MVSKNLERIKVILAEKHQSNKWLAGQLEKVQQLFLNGVQRTHNYI